MGLRGSVALALIEIICQIFAIYSYNTDKNKIQSAPIIHKILTIWFEWISYILSTFMATMIGKIFWSILTIEDAPIVMVYVVVEIIILVLIYINHIRYKFKEALKREKDFQ